MRVEAKLDELGLALPEAMRIPPDVRLPFAFARVDGRRVYIAGHGPQAPDGSFAFRGKVGSDVSTEEAYEAARLTGLSILGTLKRELGDLDRVTAWLRVFGMVNSAPGFEDQPSVINGFSDLILELYGPEAGRHARSAVGLAELPFGIPVEIEAADRDAPVPGRSPRGDRYPAALGDRRGLEAQAVAAQFARPVPPSGPEP